MELFVIIVVLGLGYFAYRNYTKDVTIEKTEEVVAPYKMEPPTLDPVAEAHEKVSNFPFPQPVAAMAPAKKTTAAKPKATPAKSTAAKKAPAKKTAKPKATPAKKTTVAKPKK
jgi:hypothetical protein